MPPQPTTPGIKLDDIYFVLFRRKWLILSCSLATLVLAAVVYFHARTEYRSEAKLVIRYVMESGSPVPNTPGSGDRIRTPDVRGESIINTELEILTSWDLAAKVAEAIGPEKILGGAKVKNPAAAAARVMLGLTVEAPRRSNVIKVSFSHNDPGAAQAVLQGLIDEYLKLHAEIHRSGEAYKFLSEQTAGLNLRLTQTEEELRKMKTEAGVVSIEETKMALASQLESIRKSLFEAETELAQRQAMANLGAPQSTVATNSSSTNSVATNSLATAGPAEDSPLSSSVELSYQAVLDRLKVLRTRELDYTSKFAPGNALLASLQEQITETERQKTKLETDHPALTRRPVSTVLSPAGMSVSPSPLFDQAQIASLQAKIQILTNQLAKIHAEALALETNEQFIVQKERDKELKEATYRYFATSLEQARIDDQLDPSKMANISVVQTPSPPQPAAAKMLKMIGALLFVGIGGALGLAFLLELYLDPRLKRPTEIERRLKLPFFLTIPRSHGNGLPPNGRWPFSKFSFRRRPKQPDSATPGADGQTALPQKMAEPARPEIAPWDAHHSLRAYYEALTDRLIEYFERMNMTHKPKLVGVTGFHRGAGVSTIAAGLAGTLSETGDGRVLLVDLNGEQGAAHPFFGGRPSCPLFDVLDSPKRDSAALQERFYRAALGTVNGEPNPVRTPAFDTLMPKLRASDYDYIVFDLPPISPTSIVHRLARYLDQLLIVAEAEKTSRHDLKKAVTALHDSNARISAVLNKYENRVPGWMKAPG